MKRLMTLAAMDDKSLAVWLRKVWSEVYPNQVSDFYDKWEEALWARVNFGKVQESGVYSDEVNAAFLELRDRVRRITHTAVRSAPYQSIRP